MFLQTLKLWIQTKSLPIVIFIGSVLITALVGMTVLYKFKVKDYNLQVEQNSQLVIKNEKIQEELNGINEQIAEERKRHAKLEADQKKAYEEFAKRQQELNDKKKDPISKQNALKDPKKYQEESQKLLDNFNDRMNCLSGNKLSCSKI